MTFLKGRFLGQFREFQSSSRYNDYKISHGLDGGSFARCWAKAKALGPHVTRKIMNIASGRVFALASVCKTILMRSLVNCQTANSSAVSPASLNDVHWKAFPTLRSIKTDTQDPPGII